MTFVTPDELNEHLAATNAAKRRAKGKPGPAAKQLDALRADVTAGAGAAARRARAAELRAQAAALVAEAAEAEKQAAEQEQRAAAAAPQLPAAEASEAEEAKELGDFSVVGANAQAARNAGKKVTAASMGLTRGMF